MLVSLSLDSAARSLTWSNRIYIFGSLLTLASAAMVLYEKRSKKQGVELRWGLATEIVVIVAAFVSLGGTIAAISFGNIVSHLKDIDLDSYKTAAGIKIAQANADAAEANKKAQEAKTESEKVEASNLKLKSDVAFNKRATDTADAELGKQNKETSDFAHALAQQQGAMAEQAKVSPVLTDYQIQALSARLAPFSGQDVSQHSTADTTVLRLKQGIAIALDKAGIHSAVNAINMGALYQGVSVAVHSPQDVPPVANALVLGLREAGVDVHPVSDPQDVAAGKVAIFLGPN